MSPPIYPTRASIRPLPAKCFLNRCSTPQKQPAATVHFSVVVVASTAAVAEAELVLGLSGERFSRAEEVKGRNRRVRKVGAKEAMKRTRRTRRTGRSEKRRGRVGDLMLIEG